MRVRAPQPWEQSHEEIEAAAIIGVLWSRRSNPAERQRLRRWVERLREIRNMSWKELTWSS